MIIRYKEIDEPGFNYALLRDEVFDLDFDFESDEYTDGVHRYPFQPYCKHMTLDRVEGDDGRIITRMTLHGGWKWKKAAVIPNYKCAMPAICAHEAVHKLANLGCARYSLRLFAYDVFYKIILECGYDEVKANTWRELLIMKGNYEE